MLSRNQKDIIEFLLLILTLLGIVILPLHYITNKTIAFLFILSIILMYFVVLSLLEGYINIQKIPRSIKDLHCDIPKLKMNLIELYVDITELIQKYKSIVIGVIVLIGAFGGYYWIEQPLSPLSPCIEPEGRKSMSNSIGMEFIQIQACEFYMGSKEERPIHKVTIAKEFYIGQYEVTQKQWRNVMGNNPSYFEGDDLPVENVTWHDVQEFIKKLNEIEGTNKYRLPSEAEWEFAARAGTTTTYFFGEDKSKLKEYAWYGENKDGKTHPIGQRKPNPWGLYDIYGNVMEWVQDKWHWDYLGAPTDGSAWESGDDTYRITRGGGWYGYSTINYKDPSSDYRGLEYTINRYNVLGFRLVRDL